MVQQEHRISYDGGQAMRESSKKVKSDKAPQRGPGIAELEKLRREESQKMFSRGTELVFHPLRPLPKTTVPFLRGFDPSFPFGYYVENFPMCQSQLLDSSPLVSSDGKMPLLSNTFQSDTSSSTNSQLSFVTSELKQPLWKPQLLFPLQQHEHQQQIFQVMNHSSLHSVPRAGLQMELELPSNQSRYGIVNASSWADQQIMMHQIVGMNHSWPFQTDVAQNQMVTIPEPIPNPHPNCGAMLINGDLGRNTDWSTDGALCLHNVGVNLNSNYPTVKRNGAFEEDGAVSFQGSTPSLVCLPSVCSSAWSPKTMSIQQFSEMNVIKRQIKESAGSKTSATPSEALPFYNFMELPYNDYLADRDVIANQYKRSWEGSDAVDVDLKL